MGQQNIPGDGEQILQAVLLKRSVIAHLQTGANKTLGFVEGHPVFYFALEGLGNETCVPGKPVHALGILPAALLVERGGQVSVV